MRRRRRAALIAACAAVTLTLGGTGLPSASAAPSADTTWTTSLPYQTPTATRLGATVASGFQYALNNSATLQWQDVPHDQPTGDVGPGTPASGDDVLATRTGLTTVQFTHRTTGTTASLTIPAGQTYLTAVGWSAVTSEGTGSDATLHVLRPTSAPTDIAVTGLPDGATLVGTPLAGGSVTHVAVTYQQGNGYGTGLVDLVDGTLHDRIDGFTSQPVVRFDDRWFTAETGGSVRTLPADAPAGATPTDVTIASYAPGAVVGDYLLVDDPQFVVAGTKPDLEAVPLAGGSPTVLRGWASGDVKPSPDGTAYVADGTDSTHWGVERFSPAADGTPPTGEKVLDVPALLTPVDAVLDAGGTLMAYGNTGGITGGMYTIPLAPGGEPTAAPARLTPLVATAPCPAGDAACPQMDALGDGRYAFLYRDSAGSENIGVTGLQQNVIDTSPAGSTGGRVIDSSGRYVLYRGGTPSTIVLADYPGMQNGNVVLTRPRTAAAIWGQRLWTPGATSGTVTGYDVKAKKTVGTYDVGAPCTPSELQAVDHWLYWTCGTAGPAGVYDRSTSKNIPVPAGQAKLADGYLVREDRTAHQLLLTDFHSGTAVTRTIASLPAQDVNTGGYSGRWAVDRFGGQVVYLQADRRIAIVDPGVPTLPLSLTESQVDSASTPTALAPWKPVWQLSKPASWTLTLADSAGRTLRTITGDTTGAAVRASWDGTTTAGGPAPAGPLGWKLVAAPRDGQGAALTVTGTTAF